MPFVVLVLFKQDRRLISEGPDSVARRDVSAAGEQEYTELRVRLPKELRSTLWQLKIFRRIKIETFVRDAITEKLGRKRL